MKPKPTPPSRRTQVAIAARLYCASLGNPALIAHYLRTQEQHRAKN